MQTRYHFMTDEEFLRVASNAASLWTREVQQELLRRFERLVMEGAIPRTDVSELSIDPDDALTMLQVASEHGFITPDDLDYALSTRG